MERLDKYLEDKVVVGVSGGADSMCLINKLMKINKNNLIVVHINHCMRGEESDRDENFVKEFCKKNNLYFISKKVNVYNEVKETGASVEEAARNLRYYIFNKILSKYGGKYVFLAHNSDDVVETFLINLFRGTGVRGLKSIEFENGNIIRPLINMSRKEIEEYNKENNIEYIIDSTNLANDYTRNKIRNIIIPYIEDNINPKVKTHILNTINILSNQDRFIDEYVQDNMYRLSYKSYGIEINLMGLDDNYKISEIIREAIAKTIGLKDITKKHIDKAVEIAKAQRPMKLDMPKGWIIKSIKKGLLLAEKKEEDIYRSISYPIVEIKDTIIFRDKSVKLKIDYDNKDALCYYKVKDAVLRFRNDGDFIFKNKKIKLKDFLIKKGINIFDRDSLLVLAIEKRIVWIENMYIDKEFIAYSNEKSLKIEVCYEL